MRPLIHDENFAVLFKSTMILDNTHFFCYLQSIWIYDVSRLEIMSYEKYGISSHAF